jgi:alkanesulfonate monooxygenase SsuD/methylene tetrahydromethanopterin reductase-like flavin-dependent oxidoreductase (luciferase family)
VRLGAILPVVELGGGPLTATSIADGARRLERLGFDSAWAFDAIGRGYVLPDPLITTSVAAAVTDRIEVGTGVLQVPLRRPVELAHRVLSAHLVASGRLVLGVGAGSTEADFAAVGVEYTDRFRALDDGLRIMRALWRGERVGDADLTPWPSAVPGPPVLIGTWASGRWIRRAATEFDGWVASAAKTSLGHLRDGITRFRDLGGRRAIVTNIAVDLTRPDRPCPDDEPFHLRCGAEAAADRLQALADLGFDDAVVLSYDHRDETIAAVRALLPVLRAAP